MFAFLLVSLLSAVELSTSRRITSSGSNSTLPNIILILADDLGVHDVSWNNIRAPTPNLRSLAEQGVILDNIYSLPVCTPSRAALLTATYPFRYGLQRGFGKHVPDGLPLNLTILPQYLKRRGYSTHAYGKWHLGFCNEGYTPQKRGFDSFFGLYVGDDTEVTTKSESSAKRQNTRTKRKKNKRKKQKNNRRESNENQDWLDGTAEKFNTSVYSSKVISLIRRKRHVEPMFVYLSLLSKVYPRTLSGKATSKTSTVILEKRKSLVKEMDIAVGEIVDELKRKGEFDNTMIVFLSDNGARQLADIVSDEDNPNYPLRGSKGSIYEGGTKVPGFIYGAKSMKAGYRYGGLMHFVDVLPTLLHALQDGHQQQHKHNLPTHEQVEAGWDGMDHWTAITTQSASPRSIMIYNIDDNFLPPVINGPTVKPKFQVGIRQHNWKLIWGQPRILHRSYREAKVEGGISLDVETLELYKLDEDPSESFNLASEQPHKVDQLKRLAHHFIPAINPPRFMGTQTTQTIIDSQAKGGAKSGWCRGVQETVCSPLIGAKSFQLDIRSMVEVYTAPLRNGSIICRTTFPI